MTFEDMVKLFYFMTFIPRLHILSTRGQKNVFFSIFLTRFFAILKVFLTEKEKNE